MFSLLRNRFGIPGVISVIALVFAMFGGAYAATNSGGGKATASAKAKKGPRGPKGPKGDTGAAGPQGPAGQAGANGKDGANGTNGTPGKDGKSAEAVEFGPTEEPAAEPCEEHGGVEVNSASPEPNFVCNGAEGSPWAAGGTLPSEATETGSWGAFGTTQTAVSFPIPLAASIDETHIRQIAKEGTAPEECDNGKGAGPSVANPEADPGYLCIFTGEGNSPQFKIGPNGSAGAGTTGVILTWFSSQTGSFGSFAVTAPAP